MRSFQAQDPFESTRTCKLRPSLDYFSAPDDGESTLTLSTSRVLAAQLVLLAPFFNWRSSVSVSSPPAVPLSPIPQPARRYIRSTLALIAIAALIGPLRRSAPPAPTPAPAHARARILNAGIWTVHFGIDNAGLDSQRAMRDLFRDLDLDVVGLLETDLHVSRGCCF